MTAMEWLTDEEQAAWRPFVGLLFRFPALLDAQLQKDAGISHFEYMVLSSLSEAPDRALRMSQLAAMASGSVSRLSHVVSRLEAKGWVRREPSPGDGRSSTPSSPSPAGRRSSRPPPATWPPSAGSSSTPSAPRSSAPSATRSARVLKRKASTPSSRTDRALRPDRPPEPIPWQTIAN